MVSFRVITDSTADLPPKYSVPFVPVHVYAGVAEFKDKIDFTIDVLADLVKKGIKRRTSAPSVKEWMRAFESLGKDRPILAFTIGSKLSASFKSAEIAARMLKKKGYDIRVFDSKSGSIGTGLLVEHALRRAKEEAPLDAVLAELGDIVDRVRLYLVVTDMDAAARSGRIPALVGKIGKFLNIHPIFHVKDGEIHLWKTVRGMEKVVDMFKDIIRGRRRVWIGSVGESEYAKRMYDTARGVVETAELVPVDPAIGAHFGIGAFGIAFIEEPQ